MYLGTEPFLLLSVATDDKKGDRVNSDKQHVANKRQAFISTDTRRFKIQTGDIGPPSPAPRLAGPHRLKLDKTGPTFNACKNHQTKYYGYYSLTKFP